MRLGLIEEKFGLAFTWIEEKSAKGLMHDASLSDMKDPHFVSRNLLKSTNRTSKDVSTMSLKFHAVKRRPAHDEILLAKNNPAKYFFNQPFVIVCDFR